MYSYWETREWLLPPDLLIVGGGIVGASTALFYKEKYPDHEVLIIDRGIPPQGASTSNAGFACIGSISEHLADMNTTGDEVVFERIKRRWNGLNLLKETMGEEAISYEHTAGSFRSEWGLVKCTKKRSMKGTQQYITVWKQPSIAGE